VVRDTEKNGIALYHGRTLHGIQPLDPKLRNEPYSYYARSGPVGEVFMYLKHPARVGVIGLGTGTLLTYSEKGDRWTYYEINPQVVAVARNTAYFTYLAESRAPQVEVELGDARLKLAQAPLHGFDVLVLDAFGSDSIPIHLLTREAMQLYWSRLAEGGVLLLHISNNYLDLSRALGPLAKDAGAEAYVRDDLSLKNSGVARLATTWAVMARAPGRLSVVARDPRWRKLEGGGGRVWSDDYFNLLSLLRFR
ncbi:MAG: fused MFS/spermidine synthase, partial [Deltaproteobacteria bacterium]|nr:fused MFS/spermidine synthase [Deltaproteobacteria bacterium]